MNTRTDTPRPPFRDSYKSGRFEVRLLFVPPHPAAPKIDPVPLAAHKVLTMVAGTVALHYEKLALWLLTGFAAVAALVVANHGKVVATTSPAAARWIIGLFIVAAVLHTVQRIICTIVESGVVGGREGENLKLGEMSLSDMFRLLDAMSAAYPWPFRKLIEASFKKIKAGDLAHVSRIVLRMALGTAALAIAQVLLAFAAVGIVAVTLH